MDYNLWQQLILGATKPFRTGANILAQNYGSALTGKDMSKKQNQGKFLRWLAGGLTPEEQKEITEKPLKEAVKSAAGIATVAGPAGGSNIANVVLNNAIKNALYSASSSDTGNELKDAISGAAMGTIFSEVGLLQNT